MGGDMGDGFPPRKGCRGKVSRKKWGNLPSSGISAISIAAETGPIPGTERRSCAFVARLSSCAIGRLDAAMEGHVFEAM